MIYFDTSYLVRLYYQDPGAEGLGIIYANDAHLLGAAKYFGIAGKNVLGQAP